MRLYQFPFSHFCEKASWALQYCGISFEKEDLMPMFHLVTTMPKSGQSSVPVLQYEGKILSGSSAIIDFAIEHSGSTLLQPKGMSESESQHFEKMLDKQIGRPMQTLVYQALLQSPEGIVDLWSKNFFFATLYRIGFSAVEQILSSGYDINPYGVANAHNKLTICLQRLDKIFASQAYITGDQFSRLDLTMSALLYPLAYLRDTSRAMPEIPDSLQDMMQPLFDKYKNYHTLDKVQEFYQKYRKPTSAS
ncbi:MAG: glutathione S-transferase [Spirochaetota bacterium]